LQIFSVEIRHFLQNLLSIQPSRKEVQNITRGRRIGRGRWLFGRVKLPCYRP
jgi:hypothetical protein